jgi:hypothetical protein
MAAAHITTIKFDYHRWSGRIGLIHSAANREEVGQQSCDPREWRERAKFRRNVRQLVASNAAKALRLLQSRAAVARVQPADPDRDVTEQSGR